MNNEKSLRATPFPLKRPRRRRLTRGFGILESMFAMGIFTIILGVIAWSIVDSARMGNADYASVYNETSTRQVLDKFIADAHASSQVLASYTYGSTTYTSNINNTLILKAPSYDSSGNIISSSYDYIVYHLVGNAAPYTLNRLVVTSSGSRPSSADTAIATNVQSATFICLVDQTVTGDGTSTNFDLNSAVYGSGTNLVEGVVMNGGSVGIGTASTQVQFVAPTTLKPLGQLGFGAAPTAGSTIDALYSVDPSQSANQPNITAVNLDLQIQTTNAGLGGSAVQSDEITGRTNLHNH
jgi:hypothetical protein